VRISEEVAQLEAELADARAEILRLREIVDRRTAMLRERVSVAEVELIDAPPAWAAGLTLCQFAFMMAFVEAYPRYLSRALLIDTIPGRDHAAEPSPKLIDAHISYLRKKLGRETIESLRGIGWRCSGEFYKRARSAQGISKGRAS
jgi:two-component system OmpR family response regulator